MIALRTIGTLLITVALAPAATECRTCHSDIAARFAKTGMSQSFFRFAPDRKMEDFTKANEYFHKTSGTYYRMEERDGRFFQVRWQVGFNGKQTNFDEKSIDYVIGSGAHARTYLHRTKAGTLIELPLGWYAEKGGYWAMSPGFDSPGHPAAERTVGYDCMFCHNAYPGIPKGQDRLGSDPIYAGILPEGIDCARCHGSGDQHAKTAEAAGVSAVDIRRAILNPARLSGDRQMEVCMQCHLQPTSFPLPNAIKRYDRPWFSYKPGEPLSSLLLYFDKSRPDPPNDRFEIASSAYRLRKSACFLKSAGALECTTCHDPHQPHGNKDQVTYGAVCRSCHTGAFHRLVESGKHTREEDCVGCHMPQRRTDDVVHVVMTDHYIQRRAPGRDLLADKAEREALGKEAYRGVVDAYYPPASAFKQKDALYLALAQVRDKSNLPEGISRLKRVLQAEQPKNAEPWFELGEAQRSAKKPQGALASYGDALRRDPGFVPALLAMGTTLKDVGQVQQAETLFRRAVQAAPGDAHAWNQLGQLGDAEALQKALVLDPNQTAPHNALGILAAQRGGFTVAEQEFREAIRISPGAGDAHGNLANLMAAKGDGAQSIYEYAIAVRLLPNGTATRFRYAAVLNALGRFDEAKEQLEIVVTQDSKNADARDLLGNLYERSGDIEAALRHYRSAVEIQPNLARAQLDLGATLAKIGDFAGSRMHLKIAEAAEDSTIRDMARRLLSESLRK